MIREVVRAMIKQKTELKMSLTKNKDLGVLL